MRTRSLFIGLAAVLTLDILVKTNTTGQQSDAGIQEPRMTAALESEAPRDFVPGEVIVRRTQGAVLFGANQMEPLDLGAEIRVTSGGEIVYRIASSQFSTMSQKQQTDQTLAAVAAIRRLPGVAYAQPNYVYRVVQAVAPSTPNDPHFAQQWHYHNHGTGRGESPGGIGLPRTWAMNRGSDAIVVAVIDTGILPQHPDVAGSANLLTADGYDMVSDPFVGNDGDGRDSDATDPGDGMEPGECGLGYPPHAIASTWHGTHVAGIVGAGHTNNNSGIAGVNWNVRVLPIRAMGKCGGRTEDIIDAIRWAAGLPVPGVPQNKRKAHVINLSIGGRQRCLPTSGLGIDTATYRAIQEAVAANVTVVVAAGNERVDAAQYSPASCDNVITVAASDSRGHFASRYSNFGSKVEIMAPGGDVQRDDNNDNQPDGVLSLINDGYSPENGTSMAAPHVAGVAALLLACDPSLAPAAVSQKIQRDAFKRDDSHGCTRGRCGAGLLNAAVAACTPKK